MLRLILAALGTVILLAAHNTTVWPVQAWPGEYRVIHSQHGGLIATVTVP